MKQLFGKFYNSILSDIYHMIVLNSFITLRCVLILVENMMLG